MFDSVGDAYNLYKQEAPPELYDVLIFSINTQLLPQLDPQPWLVSHHNCWEDVPSEHFAGRKMKQRMV